MKKNKIAYIYLLYTKSSIGVFKKPIQQINSFRNNSKFKNLDIYVLNISKDEDNNELKYINVKKSYSQSVFIFLVLFNKLKLIEDHIELNNYSDVIFRYSGVDRSVVKFAEKNRVFVEIHSKIEDEIFLKLSYKRKFLKKVFLIFKIIMHKLYFRKFLQNCVGIFCNSNQLKKYLGHSNKTLVVSNGIDNQNVNITGFMPFDERILKLGTVISRADDWHGIQRLIDSFASYNGKINIEIHIIGNVKENYYHSNNSCSIFYHGVLIGEELDGILSKLNIGVAPLALYKKRLSETSALKTVEYFSRGLPFIIGYKDIISNYIIDYKKYVYEVPNDSSLIDIDGLLEFCRSVSIIHDKVVSEMRNCSEEKLEWDIIFDKYIAHIINSEKKL